MDDLDKILDESSTAAPQLTSQASTTPAGTSGVNPASIENDDDFLAFLNDPDPVSITPMKKSGDASQNCQTFDDSEDFLEWLQDSPRTDKKKTLTKNTDIDLNTPKSPWKPSESFIETSKHLHRENHDTSKESMDNFFNDVFGSPNQSTKSNKANDNYESDECDTDTFDEKIAGIIQSSFPDIQLLRQLIWKEGKVPQAYRGQVWSLLLNESCVEDEEVRNFSAASVGFSDFETVASDCSAVISSSGVTLSAEEAERAREDMQDILVLYCQRRSIPYNPILCRLLCPLIVTQNRVSRTLASSCFYSLVSMFIPLINLNPIAYQMGACVTHSLTRQLLAYHSPALVLHLDRVLPHWCDPAAEITAHQSVSIAAVHKRNNELDELERELGLDVLDDSMAAASGSAGMAGEHIESALPSREAARLNARHGRNNSNNNSAHGGSAGVFGKGCLPTHWIVGLFSGSVPPAQAAMLLDWAVLAETPFAGVYLTAALLKIYSHSLLKLPGPRIRQWFEEVAMNKTDWYRNISVSVPDSVEKSVDGIEVKFIPDDWSIFTKGWIHCTTALMRSTPCDLKNTVTRTPEWAQLKAEERTAKSASSASTATAPALESAASTPVGIVGRLSPFNSSNNLTSASDGIGGDLDDSSSRHSTARSGHSEGIASAEDSEAGKSTFMSQFRRLSLFQTDSAASADAASAKTPFSKLRSYPHEKLNNGHPGAPLCITAAVDEVIPCICTNRRRALAPENLIEIFYSIAFCPSAERDRLPIILSPQCFENQVFYFGIDCRSEVERCVGQFPKAYAFDPAALEDADEVTKLLDMVETMAASAHLCLIGPGEDFLRWSFEQANSRRSGNRKTDAPQLALAIEESAAKVNAVAMFFLKRSFKHVSILDGGFIAAAKYLNQPNSPLSLTAALVDCNRAALESLLGIAPALPPTGTTAKRDSIVSYLTETTASAPSKLLSVGTYFKGSRSASPVPTPPTPSTPTLATTGPATPPSTQSVPPAAPTTSNIGNISSSATSTSTAAAGGGGEGGGADGAEVSSTKQLFSAWGKKITMFSTSSLESIKKAASVISAGGENTPQSSAAESTAATKSTTPASGASTGACVGVEEYEDDGMGPKTFADTTGVKISRTDKEREQALSLHRMAGLCKGDKVVISRQSLPGAILFPSIKYKEVLVDVTTQTAASATTPSSSGTAGTAGAAGAGGSDSKQENVESIDKVEKMSNEEAENAKSETEAITDESAPAPAPTPASASASAPAALVGEAVVGEAVVGKTAKVAQQLQVHRYLVVSRERFIVLDAGGGGVGSEASVKSNRHLTELIKMTFKKKDPELVTLFFVSPDAPQGKPRQYRVSKRQEFVTALQKNMERFR